MRRIYHLLNIGWNDMSEINDKSKFYTRERVAHLIQPGIENRR